RLFSSIWSIAIGRNSAATRRTSRRSPPKARRSRRLKSRPHIDHIHMRTTFFIILALAMLAHAQNGLIPIQPGAEPTIVTKLRVTDCRAVRGFTGAPVDGSLSSAAWDGRKWEYHMPDGGVGVEYSYLKGDGLHITFADDEG